MKLNYKVKQKKNNSTEIVTHLLLTPPYIYKHMYLYNTLYNAKSDKRSAKCSNFKEDDRALPLEKLLLCVP